MMYTYYLGRYYLGRYYLGRYYLGRYYLGRYYLGRYYPDYLKELLHFCKSTQKVNLTSK